VRAADSLGDHRLDSPFAPLKRVVFDQESVTGAFPVQSSGQRMIWGQFVPLQHWLRPILNDNPMLGSLG